VRPATPEIKSPTAMEGLSDVQVGEGAEPMQRQIEQEKET